jgi:hypothetical protein
MACACRQRRRQLARSLQEAHPACRLHRSIYIKYLVAVVMETLPTMLMSLGVFVGAAVGNAHKEGSRSAPSIGASVGAAGIVAIYFLIPRIPAAFGYLLDKGEVDPKVVKATAPGLGKRMLRLERDVVSLAGWAMPRRQRGRQLLHVRVTQRARVT